MTDEQIIKLFKYCNESDCEDCYGCSARENGKCTVPDLGAQMARAAERQMAEIERLSVELKAMRGAANSYKLVGKALETELQTAKSEAIKEFAKYIINKSENGIIKVSNIPDYAKEMTEGK